MSDKAAAYFANTMGEYFQKWFSAGFDAGRKQGYEVAKKEFEQEIQRLRDELSDRNPDD